MGYIDDFLKKDDEETPYWERGDTNASPQDVSGIDPNSGFEEQISNQLAAQPDIMGGEMRDYTPDDDAAFQQFIGGAADPSALDDAAPAMLDDQQQSYAPPSRDLAQDAINNPAARSQGPNFEQQALADMRKNVMSRDNGFNGDDGVFAAIAAALDVGLNKGRDLGAIAGGIGQGLMARQKASNDRVDDLGKLSIQAAQQDRADKESMSREDYYQHSRAADDQRLGMERQRLEGQVPLQAAQIRETQARAGLDEAKTAFAAGHGGVDAATYAQQQRQIAEDAHRTQREGVADDNTNKDNVRADKQIAAAAAVAAAKEAETQRRTTATDARNFTKDAGSSIELAQTMKQLQPLIDKYTTKGVDENGQPTSSVDMPGVDPMMGLVPEFAKSSVNSLLDWNNDNTDASEIAQLRGGLNAAFVKKISGANSAEQEQKRLAIVTGTSPGASDAQFQVALRNAKELLPLTLAYQGTGREDAAQQVLQNAGLAGPQAPAVQPNATAGRVGKDPALEPTPPLEIDPNAPPMQQQGPDIGAYLGEQPQAAPTPSTISLTGRGPQAGSGGNGLTASDNGDGTVTVKFPGGASQKYRRDDPRLARKGVIIQ